MNLGGSKAKPRKLTEFHPFRERERTGVQITKANFKLLQEIGDAYVGGKVKRPSK